MILHFRRVLANLCISSDLFGILARLLLPHGFGNVRRRKVRLGTGVAGGRRCEELVEMRHLDAKPLATPVPASRAALLKGAPTPMNAFLSMHIASFMLQQ